MVTRTGFEPVNACVKGMWVNRFSNEPHGAWSRTRTYDRSVNSRLLYHWAIQENWSGKRGSNPRPRPWQGRALPLSYFRISATILLYHCNVVCQVLVLRNFSFNVWRCSLCISRCRSIATSCSILYQTRHHMSTTFYRNILNPHQTPVLYVHLLR